MSDEELDQRLLEICLSGMADAAKSGIFDAMPTRVEAFQNDPTWPHFGFDTPKFIAFQAVGNYYTAIFRKIGFIYEQLIVEIVKHCLGLSKEDQKFVFDVLVDGVPQERSLDVGIDITKIKNKEMRQRVVDLLSECGAPDGTTVAVIEVRACYMIGDSKRVQADEHAARSAFNADLFPIMLIFCSTSLADKVRRLRKTWPLFEGFEAYEFVERLTGYDLQGFLNWAEPELKKATDELIDVFDRNADRAKPLTQ